MSRPTASRALGARLGSVAGWALVAVLAVVVVRRYVPDYDLPDLGPAPDASHATLDGDPTGPADFGGRVVVLNVWATWCPPCVVETPGFVDLSREFADDVQFLGLSVDDDPADVRAFAARHGVPYPLLVGPPLSGAMPHAPVLPTTLVIDRAGRVRLRHEGLLLEPALRPILRTLAREPAPSTSADFPS
ncbi:TlpA family protein disulfide reductase [Rubrivirga sp. IMCC45206]|uniref:TlpA family protein disulfide reductase n=1 Tax=Rubrivirga sp. IMCC45206 TaxID=3391614 RepID=UPI0039901B07